jgi:glutamine synthetase
MCDQVDSGQDLDDVIRETIRESQVALFSGDGYSSELHEFAEKGGLIHLKNSPDAYQELTSDKNLKLFVDLEIFNEREIAARQEVLLEAFATELRIEARTLLDILQTHILPAAMQDARLDSDSGFTSRLLSKKRDLIQELLGETDSLEEAFGAFPGEEALKIALYAQDTIKPLMESARAVADQLEGLVDRRLWPLPTYTEILYDHQ